MPRLLDRNRQVPYGLTWYENATGWQPRRGIDSFEAIVQGIINHRNGNPAIRDRYKLPVDHETVANQLDAYNALICQKNGWTQYISNDGGDPPKAAPPLLSNSLRRLADAAGRVKQLIKGYNAIEEFRKSGEKPVEPATAEQRAQVCAVCPMNQAGDFTKWFTVPYAEKLRKNMEETFWRDLRTSVDERLNICEACLCPMRLKVHVPFQFIAPTLDDKTISELRKGHECWVLKENEANPS